MILLYTGPTQPNTPQQSPNLSLGGFVSSTQIRNGSKNSIFDDLSHGDIRNKRQQIRLIVLKNTTGSTVNNIQLWTEKDPTSSISIYTVALVLPSTDSCGNAVFEKLMNDQDLPYIGTFVSVEGNGNKTTISSLADQASIGIWVLRNIDTTNTNYFDNTGKFIVDTCQQYTDMFTNDSNFYKEMSESLKIQITY